jgi:peptidoglycan/LPS O-acetylase OafA/YrhL
MRNRYIDLLRALAIARVVVYHSTGWAALTIVFPAMSVMFALAGSLMAASLDRSGVRAVAKRLRRLLPPLWAAAAVFVPAMLLTGLPLDRNLVLWILPLSDPPDTDWGSSVLGIMWYVREYLWFVLLSPIALPLFRRFPLVSLAVPYALLGGFELGMPGHGILRDFGLYFGAWLLGFAHHDGMLKRIARARLVALAVTLAAAGAAWFLTHPSGRGFDLNDIHIGNALWSAGFMLALLGLAPSRADWVDRWRPLGRLVSVLNARAVTVFLWHQSVISVAAAALALTGWRLTGALGLAPRLALVVVLLVLPVVLFGWVEDVSGRRRPVLVPGGVARSGRTPAVAGSAGAEPAEAAIGPNPADPGAPESDPAQGQWSGARIPPPALPRRRGGAARAEAGRIRPHHHAADPAARTGPRGRQGRAPHDVPVRRAPGTVRSRGSADS